MQKFLAKRLREIKELISDYYGFSGILYSFYEKNPWMDLERDFGWIMPSQLNAGIYY